MLAMASVRPLCASTARPCRAPRTACRMVVRAQQQQQPGMVSQITRYGPKTGMPHHTLTQVENTAAAL